MMHHEAISFVHSRVIHLVVHILWEGNGDKLTWHVPDALHQDVMVHVKKVCNGTRALLSAILEGVLM